MKTEGTANRSVNIARDSIDPYIQQVRGKSNKIEVYRKLNAGQKALFSFYVYYDHAKKGMEEYLYYSGIYTKMGFMEEIIEGSEYFGDSDYSGLIREIANAKSAIELESKYESYIIKSQRHIEIMAEAVERNTEYYT